MNDQPEKITFHRPLASRLKLGVQKSLLLLPLAILSGLKGILAAAALVACAYLAIGKFGLPAFHFSYDYVSGYGAQRYKTACRYLSPYGVHERPAIGGRCAWVVLVKRGTA
jgi:hypothetical protein